MTTDTLPEPPKRTVSGTDLTLTDLTLTGVNVQIVDGSGYTDNGTLGETNRTSLTGLGNLIIGYNGAGNEMGSGDIHTGSHNLILGDQNNYASFGGLIAGRDNAIGGPYASVSGGNLIQSHNSCWSGGSYPTP